MQLTEVFYYALLTITVAVTCVQGGRPNLIDRNLSKRMRKRDTALLVDSYPTGKAIIKQPRFIYSKIRKHRRGKPVSKYPRYPSNYVPAKPRHKPGKKFNNQQLQLTTTKRYKKRTMKPTYDSKSPISYQAAPTVNHYTQFVAEPSGFAEPPARFADLTVSKPSYNQLFELMSSESSFGEPPAELFGTPMQFQSSSGNAFVKTPPVPKINIFDEQENKFGEEHNKWRNPRIRLTHEMNNEHTPVYTAFAKPVTKPTLYTKEIDHNYETLSIPHSDVYQPERNPESYNYYQKGHDRPSKLWKLRTKYDNKVLVGGQYAEPPARYMLDFHQGPPSIQEDFDAAKETSISSYVNYKNSNMAFSPQNLNDAFGTIK